MKTTVMIALLLMAGCASIQPEAASRLSDQQLCMRYTIGLNVAADVSGIRHELDRRGLEVRDNYCVKYQKH
jgi:uncharacterized protein YcfL